MAGYRQQVVTFLDIMGFRNIVGTASADEISVMLDHTLASAAPPSAADEIGTSVISFSDSIIRARPCGKDLAAALFHEVAELARAQWSLMNKGILVRGGVTAGEVLVQSGRAFGPAFIKAYDLESSWAKGPRILIDPTIITSLRDQARVKEAGSDVIARARALLAHDSDGLWFVDYVRIALEFATTADHRAAMLAHRDEIIRVANTLKPSSAVLPKYLWLIRYYNESARKLHPGDKGLEIKRTDVALADRLLLPSARSRK
ncbi:MAG: hypothetical protein EON59_05810 [Alphaproteobacteria bacterium]|nr:MAG: hypothetical protein EON59_05810 [Alphaproteobacteria bacterium]